MARSQDSSGKKEKEKNKERKRKEKAERKEERKQNSSKGKGLDDMLAYVDEYGNITSTPPDASKKVEINLEDIQINVPKQEIIEDSGDIVRKGIVTFFNDSKGYGFIVDQENQRSIFVHVNGLLGPIRENDKVTFEVEQGQKGPVAVKVKKQ